MDKTFETSKTSQATDRAAVYKQMQHNLLPEPMFNQAWLKQHIYVAVQRFLRHSRGHTNIKRGNKDPMGALAQKRSPMQYKKWKE